MPRKCACQHSVVVFPKEYEQLKQLANLRGQPVCQVLKRIINAYFDDIMRREIIEEEKGA